MPMKRTIGKPCNRKSGREIGGPVLLVLVQSTGIGKTKLIVEKNARELWSYNRNYTRKSRGHFDFDGLPHSIDFSVEQDKKALIASWAFSKVLVQS